MSAAARRLESLISWHLRCGPGCTGFLHQEHTWVKVTGDATEQDIRVGIELGIERDCGVLVLAARRDPDATPPDTATSVTGNRIDFTHVTDAATIVTQQAPRAIDMDKVNAEVAAGISVAYLVTFRSPWRLNDLRKELLARCPEYAGKMIVAGDHVF